MKRTFGKPPGHWDLADLVSDIYHDAVHCGDLISVRGQVDLDTKGKVLNSGDLMVQARNAAAHIRTVVAEFGVGPEAVTRLVAYYANDGSVDEGEFLTTVGTAFGSGPGPAVTAVPLPHLALPGLAVEIDADAMLGKDGSTLPRTHATGHGTGPLPKPFSHAVRCGQMIFVSGQVACDASGVLRHPVDIIAQSEVVMENLAQILGEFGATLDDAVKLRRYFVGGGATADWQAGVTAAARHFGDPGPVATEVPVQRLLPDGAMVKIDLIAMLDTDGSRLPRRHVGPDAHWTWPVHLPYAQGVQCGDLFFVGAQPPFTRDGKVVCPGDVAAQTKASMDHVVSVLADFGLSTKDVVRINAFYKGSDAQSDLFANIGIRNTYFSYPGPASTGIPLPSLPLPGMIFEAEVLAMPPEAHTPNFPIGS